MENYSNFFYDVLVYIKNLEDHLQHLKVTLSIFQQYQLYAKITKCHFGCKEVEYLDHIISEKKSLGRSSKDQFYVETASP